MAGAGNGDYRGELLRGLEVIVAYQTALGLLPGQALVRLDGLYGNGAIVVDLIAAAVGWVIRSKDYGLLDLPEVKVRLALPADEQFTHPESGLSRDLFDCGQLPVTAQGHRSRLIVATHQASTSPVGVTRDGMVYELFFTALPALGFTAGDVLKFAPPIGEVSRPSLLMKTSSRTVIGGVRLPHRGKRVWQILSQWMWNLRQELSQQWQPTPMRLTVFAEVQTAASPPSAHVASQSISEPSLEEPSFGPPQWARAARVGSLGGEHFVLQPTGTLRCPQGAILYQQERRPEHDGTLRVLYSARIADCRVCPIRTQCQGHGTSTKKPRLLTRGAASTAPIGARKGSTDRGGASGSSSS